MGAREGRLPASAAARVRARTPGHGGFSLPMAEGLWYTRRRQGRAPDAGSNGMNGGFTMMVRRAALRLLGGLALVLVGLGTSARAEAAEVIKLGTLAPKSSPWGKVFTTWQKALTQKGIDLQVFYNGQQGDEGAMVGKMKSGQLDGAAVTAVGLSKIYKPILALQMPGLFRTWAKLDAARDALKGEFEKGARDAGFFIGGWGDVGLVHTMSRGFAIRTPDDIRGKKPYVWRDDAGTPILYQVIGGVTPVPLNITEVLPNLNTGAVNLVISPALAAEQLQWSSKIDTVVDETLGYAVGALVISSRRVDALPADMRAALFDTGRVAAQALTRSIRSEDAAAWARIKGKAKVVSFTGDERAKWRGIFKQARQRLGQGTFPADLVNKLEAYAQ